jgi:hypothetical protein
MAAEGPKFTGSKALQKRAKVGKKAGKKSAVAAESKKAKRKRLRKMAQSGGDPRQRLAALGQLDAMSMARAEKDGTGVLLKGAKRKSTARLQFQAVHSSDPATRLRAQEQLRRG